MKKLTIAMVAPAWLTVPAKGYGGIESVVDHLCRGLNEAGIRVEFFGVEGSRATAIRRHWTYREEQYAHLTDQMFDAAAIPAAHLVECLERIRRRGDFDLIHDHNVIFGPAIWAYRDDLPPVLHTLHGPFATSERLAQGAHDTDPLYMASSKSSRLYFNAISQAQASQAPVPLRKRIIASIHHGIDPSEHELVMQKSNYFVNVGRIAAEKGIDLAIQACAELETPLKLAGVVAGMDDPRRIAQELATPSGHYDQQPDFIYFRDRVAPLLKPGHAEYVGSVSGRAKDELIGRAKAFLMPIQWDEPFGVAVIDALVCGTPVVAMRRGSMPEIIKHGVNGFLANTPEEFKHYMTRVNEIDPLACRRTVEERFSYRVMAQQYLSVYQTIIRWHAAQPMPGLALRGIMKPRVKNSFYERLSDEG